MRFGMLPFPGLQKNPDAIIEYAGRYNMLAGKFLKYCLSDSWNVMISPLSILLLLSILADSTAGETREEILKVMGSDQFGNVLSQFKKAVSGRDGVLSVANSVCVKRDIADKINLSYRDMIRNLYGAALFPSGDLKRVINEWVNHETHGMITDIAPDNIDKVLLCLINAVAFEEAWADPYEDDDVKDQYFYNADGTKSRVNMLCGSGDDYIESEDFTGFTKHYECGDYSFMALLPKEKGVEALAGTLVKADFTDLYRSGRFARMKTKLPEFCFEYSQELIPLCKMMGITELFTDQADFSPAIPEALKLDSILHKTFIEVNQTGTRAAAVTAAYAVAGCLPSDEYREVILNRPFVFAIVHSETGIPVFTGVVSHLEDAKADPERLKRMLKRNRRR